MGIESDELDKMERAGAAGETQECQMVSKLVSEVRSLRHQLADPNYLYACGRIHRQAILCREAEIDKLRAELRKLQEGLECLPESSSKATTSP